MHTFHSPAHRLHGTDNVTIDGQPYVMAEVPERAERLLAAVRGAGLGPVEEPRDFGMGPIEAVHDAGYLAFLRAVYADSAAYFKEAGSVTAHTFSPRRGLRRPHGFLGQLGYYSYGSGSPILQGTWQAAYWSAQCALAAAECAATSGGAAYALCRPPGHHAAADLYGGFCYLNNAAIAARALGPGVAVLDIDYHHGNGTQMIFYDDPDTLFCSLHAHPDDDYPFFWGAADERGAGRGLGANHNFPLPQNTGDGPYLEAIDQALAVIRGFAPRRMVVSFGLDIIAGDPVGGFAVTTGGLAEAGRRIAALRLPTAIIQEGGYLLEHLGSNAAAFLEPFSSLG